MFCYFFLYPRSRVFLISVGFLTASIALPQLLRIQSSTAKLVEWYPGYTIHNDIVHMSSVTGMIRLMAEFWWQNLGLHAALIPVGFFLIPKNARRALVPILPVFLIPNFYKFSMEASANHKFFNFFMMLGAMISAYMLVWFWQSVNRKRIHSLIRLFAYSLISLFVLLLTLSGIIDFFVVANDSKGSVSDIPANREAAWIAANTPPGAVFLNSSYLFHPASIAGRSIYLGWPYFAWSAGYSENRSRNMDLMYEGRNPAVVCPIVAKYNISYVTVEDVWDDKNLPKIDLAYFLDTYKPVYLSRNKRYAIFRTKDICGK
jgi:hypothetical protein